VKLVLASSSIYRRSLLERLKVEFECDSPNIDESQFEGESAADLVKRLSIAKAHTVAEHYTDTLIISSDQVAVFGDQILGKPGEHDKAMQQLQLFSDNKVEFFTGLCLLNTVTGEYQYDQDTTTVQFKSLTKEQIHRYLIKDQPYQCAGSFRSEGLGCALFRRIESCDPNALIGLPLIKLSEFLENEGQSIL